MKKKVNGKVIDINNMDLFEKAFEGLAMGRLVSSSVADTLTENSDLANQCIEWYENIYKCMPFPLYAIEENIKYVTIGMYIRDKIDKPLHMWADMGLYIMVDDGRALKFVGNSWGIISVKNKQNDNINIDEYRDDIGFNEYSWVLSKLMKGESLKEYYKWFMREFFDACNGDPTALRWELSRILDFGHIPEKLNLKENRLICLNNCSEYFIDIFYTGKRKTKESEFVISLVGNEVDIKKQSKYVKTFDFEVYEKKSRHDDIMSVSSMEKMQKINLDGAAALFETLVGKGNLTGCVEDIYYTGIIYDDIILYQIGSQVYKCTASKYTKAVEIARNVEIYGFDNGFIYLKKACTCSSGMIKETIYSYNIKDGTTRLCKIQFT